jgi:hypothetical protein
VNLIYEIFKKLNNQEIRQLKHKIQQASFRYEKVGKLFDLVTRYEEKEEAFYSQKLYGKDPDNTFRVSKSRLKRMLENVILNDRSLTGYKSAAVNAQLQAQKKLLQGEILLGRGAYQASKNLLFQVISTARKYGLYHEAFRAEMLLYRHQSVHTSVKEYQKRTDTLLEANRHLALINEGLILQYYIANLLRHKTLKDEEMTEVREKIDRMGEIAELTQHPLITSGYYLTENFFLQASGRFEEARVFGERYLQSLQQDNANQSSERMANAYAQLAKIELQLNQIESARHYSQEVLRRCDTDGMNYLLSLELPFRAEFFDQQYEKAQKIAQEAFAHPRFETSKMISAQWHYFHACLLFRMGQFKDAYRALDGTTPLLTDKYGRNPSIRLLEIMILYELGHHDIMETKILNLKQYIKRTQKKSFFRQQTLLQILMQWYKRNYDFVQTVASSKQKFKDLTQFHQKQPFDTSDLELVRLEEWMREKM